MIRPPFDRLEVLEKLRPAYAGQHSLMLPGACVQLRLPVPPVDKLRAAGVAMAVATDLNPGTSPVCSMPETMSIGCALYGMEPLRALASATLNAELM